MKKITKISKIIIWLPGTILLVVWGFPALAYANTTVESSTGSVVGDILMILVKLALVGLSGLASFLASKAITYFENKTKIDIPAATEKMFFDWADQAVGFAHEKAHQFFQDEGKILSGNDKLNVALQFVLSIAKGYNLEGVAENKLKDYINAKLGNKRMADTGTSSTPPYNVVVAK